MADVNDDNASEIPLPASAEVNNDNASEIPLPVSIVDNAKMIASQAHIVVDEDASTIFNDKRTGSNMTKKLLQARPELAKVRDIYERTPLHFAVEINKPGIIRVLLKEDASLAYLTDKDGWSPLHVLSVTSTSKNPTLDMIKDIIELCPDSG
ncbi:ankyrin repeat-containing protein BDA1-like [Macadamia integrifolia]|uniref:ankyrin repeat-containing protein BDA1-like n=1 Tax=Macadamia integrifolia TaxID=60698 RepID=UPI001C4F8C02|nr:ankyrin repeat-containing protein BDA1-like [Macadamia integrifolia]